MENEKITKNYKMLIPFWERVNKRRKSLNLTFQGYVDYLINRDLETFEGFKNNPS